MTETEYKSPPAHWDDFLDEELKSESDRACVILAAALLDSALETLLKSHLLPSSSASDPFFDHANAPLSTFSARIEMAYRLGLIDPYFAKALNLIRRIRNDFAHNISGCDFDDTRVMSRMTELGRTVPLRDMKNLEQHDLYPRTQRGEFQMIVSLIQWLLRSLAERIGPIANGYKIEIGDLKESDFELDEQE